MGTFSGNGHLIKNCPFLDWGYHRDRNSPAGRHAPAAVGSREAPAVGRTPRGCVGRHAPQRPNGNPSPAYFTGPKFVYSLLWGSNPAPYAT